ncbi:hypothetical protein IFM89_035209 [Coptis chinensis]|uniref:Reverse transcriptase n=1 Tax=Coptis chinensis TaxID=261450 RepID=A0A835IG07_9MAGN|nr:hypothetical protein IFM89_035209 [Coptis chinensis]
MGVKTNASTQTNEEEVVEMIQDLGKSNDDTEDVGWESPSKKHFFRPRKDVCLERRRKHRAPKGILRWAINWYRDHGFIKSMVAMRGHPGPSHLLFADDIIIFSKGDIRSLRCITNLLQRYAMISGQFVNKEKCKLFMGCMPSCRQEAIAVELGIKVGCLPEEYLGVPLIKGRVTRQAVAPLLDKIKRKITAWKGKCLSFQGRIVMINSVMCSIRIHNMAMYK